MGIMVYSLLWVITVVKVLGDKARACMMLVRHSTFLWSHGLESTAGHDCTELQRLRLEEVQELEYLTTMCLLAQAGSFGCHLEPQYCVQAVYLVRGNALHSDPGTFKTAPLWSYSN